jgi:acetate kinase
VLCKGLCDRIGIDGSTITHKANGGEWKSEVALADHSAAFNAMVGMMSEGPGAVIASKADINAIGHRIVQGAERFTKSELATPQVIDTIEEIAPLAPVHNMAHVQGLRSAVKVFGEKLPQVVVFDTTFHQTMPPEAYMYAIPYEYYEKYSIRRYGFHGTSHRYVSARAAAFLGKKKEELKIVTCHLGNGSSIAAVDGGKCVDTSMGLTPLAGVPMGTRCGDIDPSVVCYLNELTGISGNAMSDILNKKSGFLGVSGVSSDNRDIESAAANGNRRAALVHDMLAYQIKKYIGSYTAAMGGLGCVVFTGGIGENSILLRKKVCAGMEFFGIKIDEEKNMQRGDAFDFSDPAARVRTLVIATNEELMIARDTLELVESMR